MVGFLIVLLTLAAGAFLQRVSGMGMALVSVSIMSLLLGPVEGVLVVNFMAVINALLTTFTVKQWVNWKMFALISSMVVVGVVPGTMLISRVSVPLLQVIVGCMLLLALAAVIIGKRYIPQMTSNTLAVLSGIAAGFMSTLAGIAGPALTVYASASRWEQREFAATLQPIFIVAGGLSFSSKLLFGAGSLSMATSWVWPAGILGMLLGIWLGVRFSNSISRDTAWKLSLTVAIAGGLSALVRGLSAL
ncbi:MAG: sulfite exporter TauE/SafE family protein [Corynebacterium sp.]|nr:sulfite exporter TauE/SafE family protein [Corynebacterium sp.]